MAKTEADFCLEKLWMLREEYGYGNFDYAVKKLMRRRIDPDRVKRKRFSNATYKRLYNKQGWVCPECGDPIIFMAGKMEIDHKDPHLSGDDFNRDSNLRLTHPKCNREKGAKSIYEQSKAHNETIIQTLER